MKEKENISKYRVVKLDLRAAADFRSQTHEAQELIQDEWDNVSEHFGVTEGENVVASWRICIPHNNNLPSSSKIKALPFEVDENSTEISRILIEPNHRNTMVFKYILKSLADFYRNTSRSIIIDVLDNPRKTGIKKESYLSLGFIESGTKYFDELYNSDSTILFAEPNTVREIVSRIDSL